tara:strand:+ start:21992 stop:23194 length:1203 start_codon:yes stop_codon:yes gene_type:complete
MKKKLIIFLLINKISKYDFERFDAYQIRKSKSMNFEFHEMANFIYPKFSKIFTMDRIKDKEVKTISSFSSWKKIMLKKKKIYGENMIIYNSINITNLKSFKVNYFLSKNKFKTLIASNLDHPHYSVNDLVEKLKIFLKSIFINRKKIKLALEYFFFTNLGKIFKLGPDFILKCGSSISHYKIKDNIKILNGNSRDYNMFLKTKNKFFKRKYKYGLFLESVMPIHNIGDAFITNDESNSRGTAKEWLKSLNNFFSQLEKNLDIKILIAPHPKIKHKSKFSKLYNGREVLKKNLSIVTKNCELMISRDSTGFSYAAIYNKPAIFMYNNELIRLNKKFIYDQKNFAKELGLKPINIDNNYTYNEIFKLKTFNKYNYLKYIKKYLSSRVDKKINYEVIEKALDY